jgi:hypothetical protein
VDAVHGADLDAGVVLDAAAGDHVRHDPGQATYLPNPARLSME